jgi:hypothetical protein
MRPSSNSDRKNLAEIVPQPAYRYTVICWRDDCPGSLDTYGGAEVLAMAREHVEEFGCSLQVEAKAIIDVRPVQLAPDEEQA